ncbi:MAG: SDR family NAD(P)-dependent oxidoreductase [Rhodoferax sp.]|nr:SDR family NAD(P)-dependent oxidoreductase [Rhodoferax sp.]
MTPTKTAVITGASAGIGRALAIEFARRGYHLGLTARRLDRLQTLRTDLLAAPNGAERRVEIAALDVDDAAAVGPTLGALFNTLGGVDIVVVNAGINRFTGIGKGHLPESLQLIQTNVVGAIATVEAAAEHLIGRGSGQIVGISSLASLQAMPKQAAYCASKAAFSMYLDAARLELKRKNVSVTTILPGFIQTDIMPRMEKFPFVVTAEQAAREMVTLIEKNKPFGVVPAYPWKWLRPLFGHFPDSVWRKLA